LTRHDDGEADADGSNDKISISLEAALRPRRHFARRNQHHDKNKKQRRGGIVQRKDEPAHIADGDRLHESVLMRDRNPLRVST
jgi:hypothetical protein